MCRNMERMRDKTLAKRADAQKVEGKRSRRRSRMRWEDCVKRALEKWENNGEQLQKDRLSC